MRPRAPGRIARGALRLLGWSLLFTGAMLASLWVHLHTPLARDVTSTLLTQQVSRLIRGRLEAGEVVHLALHGSRLRASVRDAALYDPDDRQVIHAARIEIELELMALLGGTLRFTRADIDEGEVHLFAGRALPSLLESFEPAQPSTEPSGPPGLRAVLERLRVDGVVLQGELLGLRGLVAQDVVGEARLAIGETVRVDLRRLDTRVIAPFDVPLQVEALTGHISTAPGEGIRLHGHARPPGEQARLELRYGVATHESLDRSEVLDLRIEAQPLSTRTLVALGFEWAEPFASTLRGHVRLHGPTDALQIDGDISTDGGELQVHAATAPGGSARIGLRTEALHLDRIAAYLPRVRIAGRAEIDVAPDSLPVARVELDPFAYEQIALPRLRAEAVIAPDALRIASVEGTRPGVQIRGQGRVGFDGAVTLDLDAHLSDLARDPNLRRHLPGAQGAADARLRIHVPATGSAGLRFVGRLALRRFRYGPIHAERITLEGRAQGQVLRPRLDVRVQARQLAVAEYQLGHADLDVQGGPDRYAARGSFERAGTRTFDLEATVAADTRGFSVQAPDITLIVGEQSWRGALNDLRIELGEGTRIGLLRLANRSQRLEAKGDIRFEGEDALDVILQDFDLTALNALLGQEWTVRRGRADASVHLTGDLVHPELVIQGALRDGTVRGIDGVQAVYFATYQDGALELDGQASVGTRGTFTLRGLGQVDPTEPDPIAALRHGAYELAVEMQDFDVNVVRDLFLIGDWPDVGARLGGALEVRGTLDAPEISGHVGADALSLPGWPQLRVVGDFGYREAKLQASLSAADASGDLGKLSLWLPLDLVGYADDPLTPRELAVSRAWRLEVHTTRRRLDGLPGPLAMHVPLPVALESELIAESSGGNLVVDWRFSGDLEAGAFDTPCAAQSTGHMTGAVEVRENVASFELESQVAGDNRLRVTGSAPAPLLDWLSGLREPALPATDLTANALISQAQEIPWLCRHADGVIKIDAGGTRLFSDDPQLSMRVRTRGGLHADGTSGPEALCATQPLSSDLQIEADARWAEARGSFEGCGGGPAQLMGRLPIDWVDRLWPTASETRPLDAALSLSGSQLRPLLTPLPGIVQAEGLGTGMLTAKGTVARPRLGGRIDLTQGSLRLAGSGQHLGEIGGTLILRGDWVELDRVVAYDGSGVLRLDGGLGLNGFRPDAARVAVALSKFPTRYEGISLSFLSGNADLDARIGSDGTDVNIDVKRLEVDLPADTGRTLQSLDPHADIVVTGSEADAGGSDSGPYAVQIHLDGKRSFLVRRNDFEAQVRSELDILYRDPELRVSGYIEFQRGHFEVFGKRFDIEQGTLSFDGSPQLNPVVNLRATHKPVAASAATVSVTVTGNLNDPRIAFFSPACDGQSGALTMLLSGSCTSPGQGGFQHDRAQQQAMVAGLVGGVLTLGAQRELGRLIPTISIESSGHSYHTRVRARFDANQLIPKFLRKVVRQAYIQGAVSNIGPDASGTAQGATQRRATTDPTVDLMLELYFPYNLVGSGMVAPGAGRWGLDLAWEP